MATGTHYWREVTIMLDETSGVTHGVPRGSSAGLRLFGFGSLCVCVWACLALGVLCSYLSYDDLIVNQYPFWEII